MFPEAPEAAHRESSLNLLARAMIQPPDDDKDLGVPDPDENPTLPAGYTYLGQFIDHDITFDPASSLERLNDPHATVDFRTPRLDLDSVYGRGPADDPYFYEPATTVQINGTTYTFAGLKFLLEPVHEMDIDLPRNRARNAKGDWVRDIALIGDPRNDENLIVSQLHRVFLQFHNALVDHLLAKRAATESKRHLLDSLQSGAFFQEVQTLVRWHYQWLVVRDFLPRVCRADVVDNILAGVRPLGPAFAAFAPTAATPTIPVEFSVAAYRFGHSMVRPAYFINDIIRDRTPRYGVHRKRTPVVGPEDPHGLTSLTGFRPLPKNGTIDWKYFFPGLGSVADGAPVPQGSYRIDTQLAHPLGALPPSIVSGRPVSLAERNLVRGRSFGLPSGQWVAERVLGQCLSNAELGLTPEVLAGRLGPPSGADDVEHIRAAVDDFNAHGAPLWYYILKEAELEGGKEHGGERLGELGSRLVAGVIVELLAADPQSYLWANPDFSPDPAVQGGRAEFDLPALIHFATGPEKAATEPRRRPGDSADKREADKREVDKIVPEQQAEQLGELILKAIPYGYDKSGGDPQLFLHPTPRNSGSHSSGSNNGLAIVMDGPAKDFDDDRTLPKNGADAPLQQTTDGQLSGSITEDWIRNNPNRSIWWYFEGEPYRIVKAIKIAYKVLDTHAPADFPRDADGKVTKHILIGFMGVDPGGA
jgi:hypothetical protein